MTGSAGTNSCIRCTASISIEARHGEVDDHYFRSYLLAFDDFDCRGPASGLIHRTTQVLEATVHELGSPTPHSAASARPGVKSGRNSDNHHLVLGGLPSPTPWSNLFSSPAAALPQASVAGRPIALPPARGDRNAPIKIYSAISIHPRPELSAVRALYVVGWHRARQSVSSRQAHVPMPRVRSLRSPRRAAPLVRAAVSASSHTNDPLHWRDRADEMRSLAVHAIS